MEDCSGKAQEFHPTKRSDCKCAERHKGRPTITFTTFAVNLHDEPMLIDSTGQTEEDWPLVDFNTFRNIAEEYKDFEQYKRIHK